MSNSVTFNSDGTVFSLDGTVLNRGTDHSVALSDHAKANVGIRVHNTSDTFRYQQNGGPSTAAPSINSVQLHQGDGLIKVAGYEVKPDVAVAEKLKTVAPDLFVDPSVKAAEEAKASDAAREDEAKTADLGRHADDTLEGYHQHVVGEVSQQNLISLMVYGQRGETPPTDLLKTIAGEMGEPLGTAVDKVNAVIGGVHRQFTNLATAMGVNPDEAADWLREHRKDTSMVASQAHLMRRDVRAWLPLLSDYQAATGDGRKH
jgi:hypothetical protein